MQRKSVYRTLGIILIVSCKYSFHVNDTFQAKSNQIIVISTKLAYFMKLAALGKPHIKGFLILSDRFNRSVAHLVPKKLMTDKLELHHVIIIIIVVTMITFI